MVHFKHYGGKMSKLLVTQVSNHPFLFSLLVREKAALTIPERVYLN